MDDYFLDEQNKRFYELHSNLTKAAASSIEDQARRQFFTAYTENEVQYKPTLRGRIERLLLNLPFPVILCACCLFTWLIVPWVVVVIKLSSAYAQSYWSWVEHITGVKF